MLAKCQGRKLKGYPIYLTHLTWLQGYTRPYREQGVVLACRATYDQNGKLRRALNKSSPISSARNTGPHVSLFLAREIILPDRFLLNSER